ncbi:MAG: glycosyltransferase family 9 protein [Phycisphaerae bacterium]|nr:glycosyltransferase family 9 protein [Phycisphaerae bacterium]
MSERAGLLVHHAAIGDFLIALRLTECFAGVRWTVLSRSTLGRLAWSLGAAEAFEDFDAGDWYRLFGPDPRPNSSVVDFVAHFEIVLNVVAGPGETFSRNLDRLCRGCVHHVDPRLPEGFGGHCWQHLAGQIADCHTAALPASAFGLRPACIALAADSRDTVVIHPGASSAAKRWPLANFVRLADRLRQEGMTPSFLLGEVEQEQFSSAEIESLRRSDTVMTGLDLPNAAAVLHRCRAYVGNDSGISHLAAAVGAPTITVFTATNPRNWRPLGRAVHVIDTRASETTEATLNRIVSIAAAVDRRG